MQSNVDHEKGTKDHECESDTDKVEANFVEKQNLQQGNGNDDDNDDNGDDDDDNDDDNDDDYEDSFIADTQTCEKQATDYSEMSKHDQDQEPCLLSNEIDKTAVEQHDDGDDDDTPIWNTPRTRHLGDTSVKNKDNNLQSPRTFVNEHMTFLRSKALLNWKGVDESAEQYSDEDFEELDERSNSQVAVDTNKCPENEAFDTDYEDEEFENEDDPRKSLRDSVNKKFRETLKSQLKKELSHSDLFNSNDAQSNCDSERENRPARRGGVAFVC